MLRLQNKNILPFRFKKLKTGKMFLSNDSGGRIILEYNDFKKFIQGQKLTKELSTELFIKGFVKHPKLTMKQMIFLSAARWAYRYQNLFSGPYLHIMVMTLNCNHGCLYCHASAKKGINSKYNMTKEVAKKVIDTIFETSSGLINIEFQGGEPLMNWDVMKFAIKYATEKNKMYKVDLQLTVVSNLSLMDDEKMNYLIDNNVQISTSLDGHEKLHNFNRKFIGGNSYETVVKWIKKINERLVELGKTNLISGALATATKESLKYPKEIIDAYVEAGLTRIFIRPINPYGFAKSAWEKLGYTNEEYTKFYGKLLNYIKTLKTKLVEFDDSYHYICKMNFESTQRTNYTEEMGPSCGAVLGQVAYNWDGNIYTCDEGRMLASGGDDSFKIGKIDLDKLPRDIYQDYMLSYVTQIMQYSSMIDYTPGYSTNPYSSFIGLCPIYNYVTNGNIISKYKKDNRYKLQEWIIENHII